MPEMKIKPLFTLGQRVLLKTDSENHQRLIVGIVINPNGLTYRVRNSDYEVTEHTAIEIEPVDEEKG